MGVKSVVDVREGSTKYGAVPETRLETSMHPAQKKQIVGLLLCMIMASMALAYFGRPKAPLFDLVSPRQEMPDYQEHLPGDTSLSDRLVKSYGLAMVLVQSPYTQKNVIALESLRSWARGRFQKQPDFLHPVSLQSSDDPQSSFLEAASYNIVSPFKYWLEQNVGELVRDRIVVFHETNAYMSFRNAYFELFGTSNDSAILLARYQSERAKQGIDVLLWSMLWACAAIWGLVSIFSKRPRARFDAAQQVLANGWLLLSACYLVTASAENRMALLVSSLVSLAIGIYLRKPFVISTSEGVLRLKFVVLTFDWIALAYWISYSFLCIQVLTWIRVGSMINPDPITLLLSTVTGNFLQEPVHAKRLITQLAGISWLVVGAWTASQLAGDAKAATESRESLASL